MGIQESLVSAATGGSVPTIRTLAIAGLSLAMLLLSHTAYSTNKKQASSSKKQASSSTGNLSDQQIPIDIPYCDSYWPYKIARVDGPTQVQSYFDQTVTTPQLASFLGSGYSTSDLITPPDGTFIDPGYPLFGAPERHLYADGSDFIRFYTRLLVSGPTSAGPQMLCPKTATGNDAKPKFDNKATYYLINIVRWKIASGSYQIAASDWYVFNKSDGQAAHRQFPFTFHPYVSGDLRIFGNHNVFFVAVHIAPGSVTEWSGGTKLKIGQWISPSHANGHYYIAQATTANQKDGTTSSTEPTWCAFRACTVVDNNLQWQELPQPLNNPVNPPLTWSSKTQMVTGQVVVPAKPNGRYYAAQNNGSTGTTDQEPAWCTTSGCSVSDNGITWKEFDNAPDTYIPTWTSQTGVYAGYVTIPSSPNGHFYIAQNTGTTDKNEPGWCTTSGCTTSDNGIAWQESNRPPDNYAHTWAGMARVVTGDFYVPAVPNGHYYIAQNNGVTGTAGQELNWCTTPSCTVSDNGVMWKELVHPPDNYEDFKSNVKDISYKLHVDKVEPANIQDLKALIGVIAGQSASANAVHQVSPSEIADYRALLFGPHEYSGIYGAATLVNLQNLPVQITATSSSKPQKTSQLDADVYSSRGFWDQLSEGASAQPAAKAKATTTSKSGTQTASTANENVGSPSGPGCTTTTNAGTCTETLKVQNEGLYWWDVSVGVPFKTINQLSYASSSTGQVTPTTESKKTAYGFVALAPWREDFLSPPSLGIPHLLVGIPLSGKVLDFPFVGAGETFNLSKLPGVGPKLAKVVPFSIRFYSGLVENKTFGTASAGETPPHRWIGKLQYGIEFSVRDIAIKLTGKSSSPTASKSSSGSSSKSNQ